MKKYIVLLVSLLLIVTGCGESSTSGGKSGTTKCTLSSSNEDYSVEAEYNINYKNDLVESVKTTEIVISDNEETLDIFETSLNDTYNTMNDTYGGYTFKVSKEDGKVTSKVTIDYNKMDMDQFVKDEESLKSYVKDGKLTVNGLKEMYESMGATCK